MSLINATSESLEAEPDETRQLCGESLKVRKEKTVYPRTE